MTNHPAIQTVVERVKKDLIGGAADTAKEIVAALNELVIDSQAQTTGQLVEEVEGAVREILRVMPTLAPPINALHRVLGALETVSGNTATGDTITVDEAKAAFTAATESFFVWAGQAIGKVAQYGAELIKEGDTVFTYSMSSTVWKILKKAKEQGKQFDVIVTESRPANEGLWTVDEMLKAGIPVAVSIDANVGELVPKSNLVFVGADAISSHGFSLCKVGTYPTALVAKAHGVAFYVAADTLKLDTSTLLGLPFRVDPIHRHEVLDEKYPPEVKVTGHIFDETPPDLVTAVITEVGLLHPTACVMVMWEMKLSERLKAMLPDWVKQTL